MQCHRRMFFLIYKQTSLHNTKYSKDEHITRGGETYFNCNIFVQKIGIQTDISRIYRRKGTILNENSRDTKERETIYWNGKICYLDIC